MSDRFEKTLAAISDVPFTKDQKRAIKEEGSLIVSAGAGSGKSTVMIARIIDKLIGGASLSDMLIVTFTRASAADMRVKLTEKLLRLKTDVNLDNSIRTAAAQAIEDMSVCNIGTIHSYCQKLIKTYFYATGIDPSAVVCEESEAASLKRAAVAAAVKSAWESGDTFFSALYDMMRSRKNDDGVISAVTDVLDFALSVPKPEEYLTTVKEDCEYFDTLDKIVTDKREALFQRIDALKADLAAAGMSRHAVVIGEFGDYMDGTIDDITGTSHRIKGDATDELNEMFKALKADCKAFRTFNSEAKAAKECNGTPYVRAVCAVAFDALKRYSKRKEALGKIDYSDLEHGAFSVLESPDCMSEIAATVKYVFIDEFQDVNPLQSEIARKFKDAGAEMFLVGDIKQSIYGFRRCSPKHFQDAILSGEYTHISLAENFRSAKPVIDFINVVFDRTMTTEFGGVDYSGKTGQRGQRLVFGNKAMADGKAELVLISPESENEVSTETDENDYGDVYSVMNGAAAVAVEPDREAQFIASEITKWLATTDKPSLSSVAVLLRSADPEFCAALSSEFKMRNIKHSFGRKTKVKDFPEAVALMDIARFVDNRYDDVALYTALTSSMGGFSDKELAEIAAVGDDVLRKGNKNDSFGARTPIMFWQKLEAYNGDKYRARLQAFFALRERFMRYSRANHDAADALGYITSTIDYFGSVYEKGGNARVLEAVIDYAAERHCDLHAFIDYYDSSDFELDVTDGDDAVVISTIHSSKGLEYDFVIVADTARRFNERDNSSRIMATESGVAIKIPDASSRTLKKSVPWMVCNALAPERTKSEELRLLYVALTRAKRKLIVCGKNKNRKAVEPREAKCFLDFVNFLPVTPEPLLLPVEAEEEIQALPIDDGIVRAVKERILRTDGYKKNELPIKTCVTAISHGDEEISTGDDYTAAAPVLTADEYDDIQGEGGDMPKCDGADARARGTAYHRAMELVDFSSPDMQRLKEQCENFDLVDEGQILRAAKVMNGLAESAAFVWKERYFIADLPADGLYRDGADENILVQGVIDLLIADDCGNVTIVDYKTGNPSAIKDNAGYRMQLRLYAAAVEKSVPAFKVKHAYLYSFASGELFEVTEIK